MWEYEVRAYYHPWGRKLPPAPPSHILSCKWLLDQCTFPHSTEEKIIFRSSARLKLVFSSWTTTSIFFENHRRQQQTRVYRGTETHPIRILGELIFAQRFLCETWVFSGFFVIPSRERKVKSAEWFAGGNLHRAIASKCNNELVFRHRPFPQRNSPKDFVLFALYMQRTIVVLLFANKIWGIPLHLNVRAHAHGLDGFFFRSAGVSARLGINDWELKYASFLARTKAKIRYLRNNQFWNNHHHYLTAAPPDTSKMQPHSPTFWAPVVVP